MSAGTGLGTGTGAGMSRIVVAPLPKVAEVAVRSASATRSIRTIASPLSPATVPSVPIVFPSATISVPGGGSAACARTITGRRRAVLRCCMRDTTSWPT